MSLKLYKASKSEFFLLNFLRPQRAINTNFVINFLGLWSLFLKKFPRSLRSLNTNFLIKFAQDHKVLEKWIFNKIL